MAFLQEGMQYQLGVLGGAVVPAFLPLSGEEKKMKRGSLSFSRRL